jgi:hypothetical protein
MDCPTCRDVGPCIDCGGSSSREALLGVAGARGAYWAEHVIRELGDQRPPCWPPYAGKTREIALRKVANLGGAPGIQEVRARHCWERARETYDES